MDHEEAEPLILVLHWPQELDLSVCKVGEKGGGGGMISTRINSTCKAGHAPVEVQSKDILVGILANAEPLTRLFSTHRANSAPRFHSREDRNAAERVNEVGKLHTSA